MQPHEITPDDSLDWYKSSFCQAGECVEIATHKDVVVMRNSTRPSAGFVYFTPKEFGSFIVATKAGEYGAAR
jgi:hypothetical protein